MFRLSEVILQTVSEALQGQSKQAIDPLTMMRSKYPNVAARDIAGELTALAAQGFIKLTTEQGAIMTAAGMRKVQSMALSDSEELTPISNLDFKISNPKLVTHEQTTNTNELELDEIIDLIDSQKAPPAPIPIRLKPIPLIEDKPAGSDKIAALRFEISRLKSELQDLEGPDSDQHRRLKTISEELSQVVDKLEYYIQTNLQAPN